MLTPRLFQPTSKRWWPALLLLLVTGAVFAWHTGWLALAYHWSAVQLDRSTLASARLGLRDYRVAIDAQRIDGIAENASGLTFNPLRKTLFTVINRPPQVAELDTAGKLLRTIPIKGAIDIEGISHVRDDYFVITDEASHQIYLIRINGETREIDVTDVPRFGIAIDVGRNIGYEGVSWDHENNRLFVAKEKSPLRVFEIRGLWKLFSQQALDLQISEWQPEAPSRLMVSDLSSLTYHEATGHLFLLSDESRLLLEFDAAGQAVDLLILRAGWHGLKKTIPQAEGVAIDDDGNVFILSEPNLFYRFSRPSAAPGRLLDGH